LARGHIPTAIWRTISKHDAAAQIRSLEAHTCGADIGDLDLDLRVRLSVVFRAFVGVARQVYRAPSFGED